jgi:hypothetical protein
MRSAFVVLRSRFPALCLAALFHVGLIVFLLRAIPTQPPQPLPVPQTELVFIPLPQVAPEKHRGTAPGGNAITPYFNPYTFNPQSLPTEAGQQRLGLALNSCAPENYDRQSPEIRALCSRIQVALAADPGRFGADIDFTQGERWERELLKRKTPVLAPCMTPEGPDVIYLLTCVYNAIFDGYDSEKAPHY